MCKNTSRQLAMAKEWGVVMRPDRDDVIGLDFDFMQSKHLI